MPTHTRSSNSRNELTHLLAESSAGTAAGRIARELCARGSITAADLALKTGLARSTISTALREMRHSGVVVEPALESQVPRRVGRPIQLVALNPNAGTTVGIHLGLVEITIAVVDVAHNVICKHTIDVERDYDPEVAADRAYIDVQNIYQQHGLSYSGLLGVGVSVSGPVSASGRILHSSILPKWAGKNVRDIFDPVFQRPIAAENESTCAAIAEMTWGVAQGYPDFVYVKVELGFGGAIVQQGRIITGVAGGAGEFGHMCVVPNGEICRCGNRGCLETIASFIRPLESLSSLHGRALDLDEFIAMARDGDETVLRLVRETAENVGWGLSIISTALNPPLIIVGGHFAVEEDFFMEPLTEAYERHVMIKSENQPREQRTQIITGRFTEDDSIRGAAGLILHLIGDVLKYHSK
jgi:predicted NBD/HSP70 family sugar kinase